MEFKEEESLDASDENLSSNHNQGDNDDDDGLVDLPLDGEDRQGGQHTRRPSTASHDGSPGCFFADATLDLATAHDIAETPEPAKIRKFLPGAIPTVLDMPALNGDNENDNDNDNISPSWSSQQNNTADIQDERAVGSSSRQKKSTASMNRITSNDQSTQQMLAAMISNQPTYRPKPPRRPRDAIWAVAWVVFVPLSLTFPFYPSPPPLANMDNTSVHSDWFWVAQAYSPKTASLISIGVAFVAAQILARLLYRSTGGGDGDNTRHMASQILLGFAPLSIAINPLIILLLWMKLPAAFGFATIPFVFFVRDMWALRQWRRMPATRGVVAAQGGSSWHDKGRQTFFQALTCMALDVLSRSLRRSSFYRIVCCILAVQLVTIWAWRKCLLYALASFGTGSNIKGMWLLCVALLGGKWATGTVARIISYVSVGGISGWFAQQSVLMEEMEDMDASQTPATNGNGDVPGEDAGTDKEEVAARAMTRAAMFSMPEAYRTAEASAYQSVLDLDEGIDDDFDDEEEDTFFGPSHMRDDQQARVDSQWTRDGSGGAAGSTVKSLLITAATVSFGSVAQCGLLGGLAQFTWRTVRNVDALTIAFSQRFAPAGRNGFRGMQIGGSTSRLDGGACVSFAGKLSNRASAVARSFVRSHSDLALSHVAAYYKSYKRAANDVALLVDASGVEPIMDDDITTHMCACVCGSISGILVIIVGFILSHHRSISASSVEHLDDKAVVETMFLTYILSYTLLFTAMEPLRASIKAIYVCFAQHPQSLSQAFPLIFHRLSRISESNLV